MKSKYAFLLFCLLFAMNAYAESPVHGAWIEMELYNDWQKAGRPVHEMGKGVPYEFSIDGKFYVFFPHNPVITNERLWAGDGGLWDISLFEEYENRIIYHLMSVNKESSYGTVTIVRTCEDIMYFEAYQGDNNFIEEIRYSSIRFGREYSHYRVKR